MPPQTDDASSPTPSDSTTMKTPTTPPAFDIGEKLSERLTANASKRKQQRHLIETYTLQLSNLTKSAPRKPRDSKSVLDARISKLEKDRTVRSLSLSQEKALLHQIAMAQKLLRQHAQCESHQTLMRRKRDEIESAEEALRITESSIVEIEKALATVQLSTRLGCTIDELVTREYNVKVEKINEILLDIAHLLNAAEKRGLDIAVDKTRGKLTVKGNERNVLEAISLIEESAKAVDEAVELTEEQTVYLLSRSVLADLKSKHEGVKFNFLTRLNKIILTGSPNKVNAVKDVLLGMNVVSKTHANLDASQSAIIIGQHGASIHTLSTTHGVAMVMNTKGETSQLRIVGPATKVDAALAEVTTLLFDNELVDESFVVDELMKRELTQNSGAGMKMFEDSVNNAISSTIFVNVEWHIGRDVAPTLRLKCPRSVMDRVKTLVTKKIADFESNIVTISVSRDIIPAIIGKNGSKIESLRQLGASVMVSRSGAVKIYSHDAESREVVKNAVKQIVDENQIGFVDVEKKSLGYLFGDNGKEVMAQVANLSCSVKTNYADNKLIVKGTKENIAQTSQILNSFLEKHHVLEINVHAHFENVLFDGGEKSLLNTVKSKHNVKSSYRKNQGVLQLRGEADKIQEAKRDIEEFLYGGEGIAVITFKVPKDTIGSIVGKGGCNLTKLETEFEDVRIYIQKKMNTVSLRGPEDSVKKCHVRLVTEIATYRVVDSMNLTPLRYSDLSNHMNTVKKVATDTNTSIVLNEGYVKIRGVSRDVRDAKSLLNEYFTGSHCGYFDLDGPQYERLKGTCCEDSSHLEKIELTTGAKLKLDETNYVVEITGKKANVKRAKLAIVRFLDSIFPKQIQMVKVHTTLFKSIGDPDKLAEISAVTGASVYLDRDLIAVIINCESADNATKALGLVNARLEESQKLNYVLRFDTTDAWLLPIIIRECGKNVKKVEKDTGCTIDIFKDDRTVVFRAKSKGAVDLGKNAIEAIIHQARKESVFVELPEPAIPAFIGRGGSHIKQLRSDHNVEIEQLKKHKSTIQIKGKEEAVTNAKNAVFSWLSEWEASHNRHIIDVEGQIIPPFLGKDEETGRVIQKDTQNTVDVDWMLPTSTVRGGGESARSEAINRLKAMIGEDKVFAIEREADKEKLRAEPELGHSNAKTQEATAAFEAPSEYINVINLTGSKDHTKEFQARPLEWAATEPVGDTTDDDIIQKGTKEGRELYRMLISGDGDKDDQWDASTVTSDTSMISVFESNVGGKNYVYYLSSSGFKVRI